MYYMRSWVAPPHLEAVNVPVVELTIAETLIVTSLVGP